MKKNKKHKINSKRILILLTTLCVIFMIFSYAFPNGRQKIKSGVNAFVVPIQTGINSMGLWLSGKDDYFKKLKDVEKENSNLSKQIDELKEENVLLSQEKYELERLRNLYKLDKTYSEYKKVAARIIAKDDTGNWFYDFTINKGTSSGIKKDMNVIADGGLVGIVTEVGKNYAKVKGIVNDGYNVSGKSASSSDLCIVQGSIKMLNQGLLSISDIQEKSDIKAGDMIITSPISDKYLPGLLIGYVTEVKLDANELTKSGFLQPAVDFEHLEEVLVITTEKENIEYNTAK